MKEKMTKRMFPHFEYRECDAFAEYLHEQSLNGWHFKEWRCGLVFEKGEPLDITYAVEVFPKGSESDLKPGEDAQEYAEYCNVAGWRFLDSHQKFCIFRREREEAVPITVPEERLKNIRKAEWNKWIYGSIVGLFLFADYLYLFWVVRFQEYIFRNLLLMLLLTLCLLTALVLGEGIALKRWGRKKEKELECSGKIVCGRCGKKIFYGRYLFIVLFFIQVSNIGTPSENQRSFWAIIMLAAGIGIISLIVSFWRPLEAANSLFQIVAVMILLGGITFFLFSGKETAPASEEKTESIFGSFTQGESELDGMQIRYEISRSSHEWILDKVWKDEEIEYDTAVSSDTIWDAKKAYREGGEGMYWYYIRYPETVAVIELEMEMSREPSDKEIEKIQKELELP